jgi:hypothetical protein
VTTPATLMKLLDCEEKQDGLLKGITLRVRCARVARRLPPLVGHPL